MDSLAEQALRELAKSGDASQVDAAPDRADGVELEFEHALQSTGREDVVDAPAVAVEEDLKEPGIGMQSVESQGHELVPGIGGDGVAVVLTGSVVLLRADRAHRVATGIETVGVYSEPDTNALHVDSVDLAVALGGSTPTDSYLRGDTIIAAALRTNADAIHPGYGFLAENAEFAGRDRPGLAWVGPRPNGSG